MAKLSWKTEQRFVKDLMIAEINPRKISQEQKEALTRSLEKFNLADIPVLNTDNTIISGNQRLQILYDLGKGNDEIDVRVPNRKLSEAELKEYMLIANTHAGTFDVELLEAHFEDVSINFDIQLVDDNGKITVKGHERVKQGLTDPDEVPEPPKIAKSKPGQIYILGMHRLMCGDSTSIDEVEKLMDGKKADMVFTDPPYGVAYEGGHNKKKRKGIIADTLEGENLTGLFQGALLSALPNTKDGAAFYVWYASGKSVETFASLSKMPLNLRAVIQWYKVQSGLGAFMSQYIPNCEPCMYLHKKGCSPAWYGPTNEKTVWELKKESRNDYHPTQKPVELPERAVGNSSKQGDLILDLFGGSGSTLIACEKMSRIFYGMELDPIYIDVIIKRWQDFTGQKAILEATGQEFDSFN